MVFHSLKMLRNLVFKAFVGRNSGYHESPSHLLIFLKLQVPVEVSHQSYQQDQEGHRKDCMDPQQLGTSKGNQTNISYKLTSSIGIKKFKKKGHTYSGSKFPIVVWPKSVLLPTGKDK